MSTDFSRLASPENTDKFRRYHFLNEHYLPSMASMREQARCHLIIAEESGLCVEECEWFLRTAVEIYDQLLIELSTLFAELYPDQPPGLIRQ